ncbi:hypothetical protein RclHR1_02790001 [Rhizophagus clarus]|uniref:Uncharacterized protein n=1 Tax=Rhizophagus clarus TaxID=94130 RepID=A0A2Z6RXB7_9GLOM|nr:hypothetical protein RclHR1_02790001 [Rhizophagus clarus]GES73493.1 hypothetical protein GLOIN_2v1653257 [Rhizophagus clarus]
METIDQEPKPEKSSDGLYYVNEIFREIGDSRPEKIFHIANNDECTWSFDDIKYNDINEKREDRKVYIKDTSLQWNGNKNYNEHDVDNNVEEGGNVTMVSLDCCQKRIQSLQQFIGSLRRIGVLAGTVWTEEKPMTPCHLVDPDVYDRAGIPKTIPEKQDESRNPKNPLMIVEVIANKLDRSRVAKSLKCGSLGGSPATGDLECVKSYGFDHIIIVGKRCFGFLFLDCYGRVFEWEEMCGDLWFLGDDLDEKSRISNVIWGLEYDGSITEYDAECKDIKNSPNELTDKPVTKMIVSKKKKNSKKKNSKNKHR